MITLTLPRAVAKTLRAAARDRQRRYAARAARGFAPAPGHVNHDALAAEQLAAAVAALDAALK